MNVIPMERHYLLCETVHAKNRKKIKKKYLTGTKNFLPLKYEIQESR
jgi:hypothetical protein